MAKKTKEELKSVFSCIEKYPPLLRRIYIHYKNGDRYLTHCKSIDSNTLQPMITYICMATGIYFTKPVHEFMERTEDGQLKYRLEE